MSRIRTHCPKISGGLTDDDIAEIPAFDMLECNLFAYDDGTGGDAFGALLTANPDIKIFPYRVYQSCSSLNEASQTVLGTTSLGRWSLDARGHSMGTLYGNNPELLLYDSNGDWCGVSTTSSYVDFGLSGAQAYSAEALITDILGHSSANKIAGIYNDNLHTRRSAIVDALLVRTPVKYTTDEEWAAAMSAFIEAVNTEIADEGYEFSANCGGQDTLAGYNGRIALNNALTHRFYGLEESLGAVIYGSWDTQIYSETAIPRYLDNMSSHAMVIPVCSAHTNCNDLTTQGTTSRTGITASGRDVLWYSLAIYMLGRPDHFGPAYFSFVLNRDAVFYGDVQWYDEYTYLDLGVAVGLYETETSGSATLYKREFERGYVYLNPSNYNSGTVTLPESCRQLTYTNLTDERSTITPGTTFTLNACRAAFFEKVTYRDPVVSVPFADISAGGWTPSTGTDLYAVLDDASDDTEVRTMSPQAMEVRLTPPVGSSPTQVRVRAKSANSNYLKVDVLRNNYANKQTAIATRTFTGVSTSFETLTVNLTSEELALITDWSDLSIKITPIAA